MAPDRHLWQAACTCALRHGPNPVESTDPEACGEHTVTLNRAEDDMAKKKDLPSKKDVKGGYKVKPA